MAHPPRLFDTGLLARRRQRARRIGGAEFLHEAAALEITERLQEVNRTFRRTALIGSWPDIWEGALRSALPGGEILCVPDRETLGLEGEAFDLVVHGLGLHWSNDPVGQLIQARRALRPDGLFLGALFGGRTLAELRAAFARAEAEVLGGLSPRVAPMADIRDLGGLLQRAGFALPVADGQALDVSYETALHLMRDLRAMGETNVLTQRLRAPLPRALLTRACDIYAADFGRADGRVGATFEFIFLTGWAPAESQPKPLRPGSAIARLSEALAPPGSGARQDEARDARDDTT
jgi:SAM-dependent methyltransferase